VGKFLKKIVRERFENILHIKDVKVPVLFIHGKNDKLINHKHSKSLYGNYFYNNNYTKKQKI
jgi:dipeptidyl aminopeptidase/acylaminoacyl peptidase